MQTTSTAMTSRSDSIRNLARQGGVPVVKFLIDQIRDRHLKKVSLLAVCPNSESVARAALHAAKEADAPILFAATLNQVDTDGGYTGWTPAELVGYLEITAADIGLDTPVLACLDHGGPWLKDRHTTDKLNFQETMAEVKKSLEACLDAGYALLHIDPTVDRTIPGDDPIPIALVVERTVDMMVHAETYRTANNLPPVAYEVGTEEVHGGLANMDSFETFLTKLDEGLKSAGIEEAWPCFVVGKVGTDLHTTYFEPDMARDLTQRTIPYKALIKGHYSDYVDNPEDYPLSGMGGANVGPEFTEEEFKALLELIGLEKKTGNDSGLYEALEQAVLNSNRWQKWLFKEEKQLGFFDLKHERREWLMRTCSRYIWTETGVMEARKRLYTNLAPYRDADAYVIWKIKTAILKYYHSFNLLHFNSRLIEN
ncbi:MAG: class II D-tagatose-bisphosphate aldolase, non-catalytic subunit [Rhodothermaceae bacterium]|nr:class II D-tagatose-bisphosphate aldolase, non-catalytic subunit [Rhodothermaceae bacterium]